MFFIVLEHLGGQHAPRRIAENELVCAISRKFENEFKIKHIKRFSLEINPFGWLQTLLNISGIKFNLLYDLLKCKKLKTKNTEVTSLLGIFATFLLLPIYFPLALILSILEPLVLKRGGSIEIIAEKQ